MFYVFFGLWTYHCIPRLKLGYLLAHGWRVASTCTKHTISTLAKNYYLIFGSFSIVCQNESMWSWFVCPHCCRQHLWTTLLTTYSLLIEACGTVYSLLHIIFPKIITVVMKLLRTSAVSFLNFSECTVQIKPRSKFLFDTIATVTAKCFIRLQPKFLTLLPSCSHVILSNSIN